MKKTRKILSMVTALAVTASAFSAFSLSAFAKTTAPKETFEEAAQSIAFNKICGRGSVSVVDGSSVFNPKVDNSGDNSTKVVSIATASNEQNAAPGLHALANVGVIANVSFDFYTDLYSSVVFANEAAYTPAAQASAAKANDPSASVTTGVAFTVGTTRQNVGGTNSNCSDVNNQQGAKFANSKWYHIDTEINYAEKKVAYTISEYADNTAVIDSGSVGFMDASVEQVDSIVLRGGNNSIKAAIDNVELTTCDLPAITLSESEVSVDANASHIVEAADVVGEVSVSSSNEAAATAEVDAQTGNIKITGVAMGVSTITVTVSNDGFTLTKEINVVVGNVALSDVAVNFYKTGTETPVKDSVTLKNRPVGTEITTEDVDISDFKNAAAKYTYNGSASTVLPYVVAEDSNVINIYYDEALAVTKLTTEYKYDGNVVYTKDYTLSDTYVGDKYSYTDFYYVNGTDGVIYATDADMYTENTESKLVYNADTKQYLKSVDLTTAGTQTVTVNAAPAQNAVYYIEGESMTGGSNGTIVDDADSYIASGGKLRHFRGTADIGYTVPKTAYYQIVITNGVSRSRLTKLYKADTDETTEDVELLSFGRDCSYTYGEVNVITAILDEGDTLKLTGLGNGSNYSAYIDYILIREVKGSAIIGADGVSVISGGQTAQYTFNPGVEGTVTWTATGVEGVTIDQNGLLNVPETAGEGTVTVKASVADGMIEGTKTVTIAKPQVADFDIIGSAGICPGNSYKYSVANVKDQFGTDITALANAEFSSSAPDVVEITPAGDATVKAIGTAAITAKVTVGDASKSKALDVTAADYYLSGAATGDTTSVDASTLVASGNITGFVVTTAKDGVMVKQTTVEGGCPETIDTTGADSYEIDPIYTYENLDGVAGSGYTAEDVFVDGFYNMTFTKGETRRADIYVNDYMVGNNVDQYGEGRAIAGNTEYSINDVVVNGGFIKINTLDRGGTGSISKAVIVKAPSIVERTKKVYIIGDSLVAEYYGSYTEGTEVGGARSGWGQQIGNFFNDDYEVVNLANSGSTAKSLYDTAFPGIAIMAQPGDYFIVESGYNDANTKNNTSREEMYACIVDMVKTCEAKGVHPVLVTPNASTHDYEPEVMWASTMTQAAKDMQALYSDVIYVDLGTLSYNFMMSTGISTTADAAARVYETVKDENGILKSIAVNDVSENGIVKMPMFGEAVYYIWDADMKKVSTSSSTAQVMATYNLTSVGGDKLHSSYVAAMKWAEIVAQGMKDAGVDFINTDFSYTFTDTVGNEITCRVK